MAELTASEKIQPCLLERLTDEDPLNPQESRVNRVVSLARYRDAVLRDLRWLLNAKRPRPEEGLESFPEAAESVLNYGIPDLCGLTTSLLKVEELRRALEQVLKSYEPRINRQNLQVRIFEDAGEGGPGTLTFEIRGELWARPMPERLFIRTRLDLETGQTDVW